MYREAQMGDGSDLGAVEVGPSGDSLKVDNWKDTIPEEYRGWQEVQDAKTPDDVWKWTANMRSMIGRSIQVPSEDASEADRQAALDKVHARFPELVKVPDRDDPESVAQILDSLGRPKEASEYKLPEIEMPEGVTLDEERVGRIKSMAKEAGLTQSMYKKFVAELNKEEVAAQSGMIEATKGNIQTVKTDWGQAYENNLNATVRYLEQHEFDQNTIDAVKDGRMPAGNVKAFYSMAKQSGEGVHIAKDEGATPIMTPDEAQARMSDIRNRITQGQKDGTMSQQEHTILTRKLAGYIQMAYPED